MRRAPLSTLVPVLVAALAGCDSPAPSGGEPTAQPASTGAAAVPSGLTPISPGVLGERPADGPAATATAEPEPERIAAQHVLVAFKGAKRAPSGVTRSKADAKKRAEEAAEKAKAGEDFTELVKKYSDEPGAAERLGSLGKFARGVMAPPFESAAFGLKVGEVSGVVETEFGFHVIKRNQ